MRTEFTNISTAFGLLPTLAGNGGLVVAVNLGGTALTVVPGSTITTTGAFTTIFAQAANVTLTLPGVNGTLALLASPAFTGTPTAPTASGGTNNTQLATTAFVTAAVGSGGVVSSVAGRTGAVVLSNSDISGSAPLASPALTGNPTAPTATAGDNDTSIATTAFVQTMPAAPPPIGNTTPNTGAFTTLAASGAVSGAGFTALHASPGPIGSAVASTGAFTTLSASSTVSGAGFTAWAASPPSIGSTSPGTGAFTTLAASGAVSGAGFTARFATPGPIGNTSASTGAFTTLSATGLLTVGQTTGILGTTTNNDAQAGSVGEIITSTLLVGSAVALGNSTATNITSISLTAGDWDVSGNTFLNPAASTVLNVFYGWVSTASATLPTAPNNGGMAIWAGTAGNLPVGLSVGPMRLSLSGTTTVFLSCEAIWTTAQPGGYGFIRARRVR